jgi:hypothetical protein
MDKIRLAIIVDPFGVESIEEEVGNIRFAMENLELPVKLVTYGESPLILKEKEVDMVVVDYGGMSLMGGWDTAKANIGYVCQWAEDHPSKAVLIWTTYTALVYQDELEEQFGELKNIFFRFPDDPHHLLRVQDFDDHRNRLRKELRVWFGVEEP